MENGARILGFDEKVPLDATVRCVWVYPGGHGMLPGSHDGDPLSTRTSFAFVLPGVTMDHHG